jgi:isoquinoline 1-oxidoreductase beta subunit
MIRKVNRRGFLQAGMVSAAGLTLGFYLPEKARAQTSVSKLNAFIHIGSDDVVTLILSKSEMGQGVMTSLSQLMVEELEADWNKARRVFAPADAKLYGPLQGVFGSLSIRTQYMPLRKAAASAKEMLIEAAARKWGVDKAQLRAQNNMVVNPATNQSLSFGSLAEDAAKLTPPANPKLKDAKDFRLIGTSPKRVDTPMKVNGTAMFGLDAKVPGMQYAVLARTPVFGGKVASFDATKAKAVPGVKQVVQISNGVAVVADDTWSAMEGRKALEIKWDEGSFATQNSAGISKMFEQMAQTPGAVARKEGDAAQGLAGAAKKMEAVYEAPYLAHAPMEPVNCTADVKGDSVQLWVGTQIQTAAQQVSAQKAGVAPEKVSIETMMLGGGFGRRGSADFVGEAVEISKAVGTPVKLTWTREDDIAHDTFRPASWTQFAAGLDKDGWPVAFTARSVCPSVQAGGAKPQSADGLDRTGVEGIFDLEYGIPNILVDYKAALLPIPVSYWRSVGFSQNTFFLESFIDEMAASSGKDPVDFRRKLLEKNPKAGRLLGVLNLVADKSGWGTPLAAGRSRGVALSNNIGSFTAQVAEVSIEKGNKIKVHRVVAAVDCGQVVNPAIVSQQIQSGIVFGLTAALKGKISIDKGQVVQQNFNTYDMLRMDEMPQIEVYIVPSTMAPGGIGEASTPMIAPAVANAIFKGTGKRLRQLPLRGEDLA